MGAATARVQRNAVLMLAPKWRSQEVASSSSMEPAVLGSLDPPPALLTRMSTRPCRSSVVPA
jgi:hypothetical protein